MNTTTSPAKTRADSRGNARRKRIFKSLHDCIIAKGYVRTTLADIADSAEMSPSHLLYYFKGKEDILEQYFQLVSERFTAKLESLAELPVQQQIDELADFWFRGETSTRQEIGFMLECFGAAVHDNVLKVTKTEFDTRCKQFLANIFNQGSSQNSADAAALAYSMMIGLRSAVYFDQQFHLEDAHRLFGETLHRMCDRTSRSA